MEEWEVSRQRQMRTWQERNKSWKDRESSLSLYIHTYFLFSHFPLFPYLIFFSLFLPIFRGCVYKENWKMKFKDKFPDSGKERTFTRVHEKSLQAGNPLRSQRERL